MLFSSLSRYPYCYPHFQKSLFVRTERGIIAAGPAQLLMFSVHVHVYCRYFIRGVLIGRYHVSFSDSAMAQRSKLIGFGNPLLDMILYNCPDLMVKYNLPMDDQLLANSKTRPLFKEVLALPEPALIRPGGATQNSIRTAQWLLQEPGATAFVGAIGDDAEV